MLRVPLLCLFIGWKFITIAEKVIQTKKGSKWLISFAPFYTVLKMYIRRIQIWSLSSTDYNSVLSQT